jgi:hypothetical protein
MLRLSWSDGRLTPSLVVEGASRPAQDRHHVRTRAAVLIHEVADQFRRSRRPARPLALLSTSRRGEQSLDKVLDECQVSLPNWVDGRSRVLSLARPVSIRQRSNDSTQCRCAARSRRTLANRSVCG